MANITKEISIGDLTLSDLNNDISVTALSDVLNESNHSDTITYTMDDLAYTLSSDGTYYICSGLGDAAEGAIFIKSTHNNRPVKEIGYRAFYSKNIASVTIEYGIETIGEGAFRYCDSLTSVTIPASVKTIDKWAFSGCACTHIAFAPDSALETICSNAFSESAIESVTIPSHVKTIDREAFYRCRSLHTVTFAPNSELETIGINAFRQTAITSLDIPSTVTTIGSNAFALCRSIVGKISIPDSVTAIGDQAFYECTGITSLTVGSGVYEIEPRAFTGCTSLKSVMISDGVERIGEYAFSSNTSLTTLSIPSTVRWIATKAFNNCTALVDCSLGAPYGWFYTEGDSIPDDPEHLVNCTAFGPQGTDLSTGANAGSVLRSYTNYNLFSIGTQLPAPDIKIDGSVLTITDKTCLATKFKIYVNGVEKTTITV